MGIVDFSAHQKRVPGSFVLTLFLCIFLFHFNQLNLKIQLFSSHLMVGIKRDIGLVFCGNFYRERLARTGSADKPAVRPLLPLLPEAVRSQR